VKLKEQAQTIHQLTHHLKLLQSQPQPQPQTPVSLAHNSRDPTVLNTNRLSVGVPGSVSVPISVPPAPWEETALPYLTSTTIRSSTDPALSLSNRGADHLHQRLAAHLGVGVRSSYPMNTPVGSNRM
jgi:hypothetical protein